MLELFEDIATRLEAGETVALCTVVGARGSTPQNIGAKMIVCHNGRTIGTLGGGCVEAETRKTTLEAMTAGGDQTLTFKLNHDHGWDDGMICGGQLDVHVQIFRDRHAAARFRALAAEVRSGGRAFFEIPEAGFREEIAPPPTLIIAGGGHVAKALATVAANLDFRITVIDDRGDFVSAERFPAASSRIVGPIDLELSKQPIDDRTFIVIVTRGHKHDEQALAAVVRSPARYIGMIGSRKKVQTVLESIERRGVPREMLARVHAPIGLDIGAFTVEEIAVSIAAEMIAVRRGTSTDAVRAMRVASKES